MANEEQEVLAKEEGIDDLKNLIQKVREDFLDFSRCINEDAQTSNMYLNEILRMLTTGEKHIPILPIEIEITNFNNHRTEYWLKRTQKLKSAMDNFEKISQICDNFLLQNAEKDV